ncbi:MAG: caspase family protein, partial [Candidatus Tectomicrobia bacterium]|nr:caspase family protein [Candidatus Tectomicrobia bacterium]
AVRLTVQYAAPTRQVPSSPALHILAIGINAYRHNTALTLNYAVSDIEALSRDLRQVGSPTFRDVRYTGRTNAQATRQGVEAAFAEAAAHVQPDDVFVLMLSGHGVVEAGQYYFLPADIPYLPPDRPNVTTEVIRAHGLNTRDFQHWFSGLKTRKTVIFLDTCHSGAFSFSPAPRDAENFEQSAMRYTTSIDRLGRATGQVIVAATTAQEKALEGYNNHGFFTYVLLEALRYADTPLCGNNDGELALAEIFNFVRWRLPILSRQASGTEFEQIPRVIIQQAEWRYFQSPIGRALRPDTVPSPLPSRLNQACAKERLAAR